MMNVFAEWINVMRVFILKILVNIHDVIVIFINTFIEVLSRAL